MLGNFLKFKGKAGRKDDHVIGIDVGTSSVKMVKLNLLKDGPELAAFNLWPIQVDLKPVLSNQGIKKANVGVGGLSTVIRYINFPKMNPNELKQALKFEAQKHIPFSVSEVNLDGYILNPDLGEGKMLVVLVAAKKEAVTQRFKLFDDCAIRANLIDIDSLALVNAFNFNYGQDAAVKGKAVALLNIGASYSILDILEDGVPQFSRDIQIAGNNFTQIILDLLGLEFKAAEELKINPDKERLTKISVAIESGISGLAAELRTSFDYYESQRTASVTRIFISGGGSLFTGIKDSLANLLGIEVEPWEAFKNIKLGYEIDKAKLDVSVKQLSVALGLALRSL